MYKLSDFDYSLPNELIATSPNKKRDHSRLLILDKKTGEIEHKYFFDILDYLNKGDVLVLNNSKVFPARLIAKKKTSGGKVEVFLHKKLSSGETTGKAVWECLLGGKNIQVGLELVLDGGLKAKVLKQKGNVWELEFNLNEADMMKVVEVIGKVPLPPYIKIENRKQKVDDSVTYQTVYADDHKLGSVAAPTAGLHFTPELLEKIKAKGVIIEYITLHVGMGTFASVKTENIEDHNMHAEYVEIGASTVETIQKAKSEGRRVIAVGTTSARTLEANAQIFCNLQSEICNFAGWVNIFIYPGVNFKVVDAMITNFHLPKSSLIMLVSALAGKDNIDKAYRIAIEEKYRFYSYGDAMLII